MSSAIFSVLGRLNNLAKIQFIAALFFSCPLLAWAQLGEEQHETATKRELSRQKGWTAHKKYNEDFDKRRLAGVEDVKRRRQQWEEYLAAAVKAHKKSKFRNDEALDEAGIEHNKYVKRKIKEEEDNEKARASYAAKQKARSAEFQARLLSEEEELGLQGNVEGQSLTHGKPLPGSGSGPSGSGFQPGGGPGDTTALPPPPPPPGGPVGGSDFDNDSIIPPPPPPMDGFDDSIPPPIFDENEF